jgi:hypothetical protein
LNYLKTVVSGFSHLLNALTGGNPRYSFSARVGALSYRGRVWASVVASLIDTLLFSKNHCIEHAREEGLI